MLKDLCEKYNISYTFLKFIFVGVLNTVFGYLVFAICIFFKSHYTLAAFISTILGILFNFKTTGCLVFKNNNNKLIFKFLFVYTLTYLFSVGILWGFSYFGLKNMYINFLVVLPVNALLSYYLMKFFVFKA